MSDTRFYPSHPVWQPAAVTSNDHHGHGRDLATHVGSIAQRHPHAVFDESQLTAALQHGGIPHAYASALSKALILTQGDAVNGTISGTQLASAARKVASATRTETPVAANRVPHHWMSEPEYLSKFNRENPVPQADAPGSVLSPPTSTSPASTPQSTAQPALPPTVQRTPQPALQPAPQPSGQAATQSVTPAVAQPAPQPAVQPMPPAPAVAPVATAAPTNAMQSPVAPASPAVTPAAPEAAAASAPAVPPATATTPTTATATASASASASAATAPPPPFKPGEVSTPFTGSGSRYDYSPTGLRLPDGSIQSYWMGQRDRTGTGDAIYTSNSKNPGQASQVLDSDSITDANRPGTKMHDIGDPSVAIGPDGKQLLAFGMANEPGLGQATGPTAVGLAVQDGTGYKQVQLGSLVSESMAQAGYGRGQPSVAVNPADGKTYLSVTDVNGAQGDGAYLYRCGAKSSDQLFQNNNTEVLTDAGWKPLTESSNKQAQRYFDGNGVDLAFDATGQHMYAISNSNVQAAGYPIAIKQASAASGFAQWGGATDKTWIKPFASTADEPGFVRSGGGIIDPHAFQLLSATEMAPQGGARNIKLASTGL